MEIDISNEKERFKFRVCGVVEQDGKILFIKHQKNKFFCLPGGRVEIGEDTETAIKREMFEELGTQVNIKKLLTISQNLFYLENGKIFHELVFYYLLSPVNKLPTTEFETDEIDKGIFCHHRFNWFALNEINKTDFKPEILNEILTQKSSTNILIHNFLE